MSKKHTADQVISANVVSGLSNRGATNDELARALDISVPSLSNLLENRKSWNVTQLAVAAAFLKVRATDLLVEQVK